ncbi:MAG TPA: methyltransferase domain-containing protein [Burkholderiales bacterium]|nr:methyltransferase domain-containing protein [Burkholderiales bacterium]
MSTPFPGIDSGLARRRFSRAARTYAGASPLEAEVAERMLERLELVKLSPRRILDAGSGPPQRLFAKRYPKAHAVAIDFSVEMLRSRKKALFERKRSDAVCADLAALPLAEGSIDLAWSNMALHWLAEPLAGLRELQRVLAPEGLLMFSTLGPDTLKELRAAAGEARVHAFVDMHDLGDMLVECGFSAPVMDMEILQIAYSSADALLADLRGSGQTSARLDRPRGMAGRRFADGLRSALGAAPRATFEVVYGHAWKAAPRVVESAKTIRFQRRIS